MIVLFPLKMLFHYLLIYFLSCIVSNVKSTTIHITGLGMYVFNFLLTFKMFSFSLCFINLIIICPGRVFCVFILSLVEIHRFMVWCFHQIWKVSVVIYSNIFFWLILFLLTSHFSLSSCLNTFHWFFFPSTDLFSCSVNLLLVGPQIS